MVLNSGIVLDYDTNLPHVGVRVDAYSITGANLLDTTTTDPVGVFYLDIPDTIQSGVFYTPVISGYKLYTRAFPVTVGFINLFTRSTSNLPNVSGVGNINLLNTGLVTSLNVRDITNTPTHYYAITDHGLDIIDANTNHNVGYIQYPGGFTAIALTREAPTGSGVYVGTASSGIYKFNIPNSYDPNSRDISGLLSRLYYVEANNITSNEVGCLHLNLRGELLAGTLSGVDFYTTSGRKKHLYSGASGTDCCFCTEYQDLYYSPAGSGLHVKYGPIESDWTLPDYEATLSGTGIYPFPLLTNYINDIAVTAVSGANNNHVFLATKSGLVWYQEDSNLNVSASGASLLRRLP